MSNTTHHQDTPMKLNIIIDGYARTATLNHSQASKDFVALLPLTLTLQDYAATEKISVLPSRLTVSDSPAGTAARNILCPVGKSGAVLSRSWLRLRAGKNSVSLTNPAPFPANKNPARQGSNSPSNSEALTRQSTRFAWMQK
ncbi:cyclophilin-like fold protein [Serratia odorifera]|uniref:cyclophilin-like fold protein n=1 Tax=Serratia odorifera TaxID=618 RepID=UPI0035322356